MGMTAKTLCGLILLLALATGCGQKGPLFLPGDPSAVKTDVPGKYSSEPSADDVDDDADKDDDDPQ